ncbi:serine hydrolase [Streptomyces exfoliatus]|uniref:Serine hydrolase n=1 Tax=Streptomyces exfoliatus TaxID=1905 RepID=A0ABV3CPZ6_STREX
MLRESDAPSSSSVQVDQPTAVFKTLAPRTPEDDAPTARPTAAPEPEEPEESETETEAEAEASASAGPEVASEPATEPTSEPAAQEPESARLKAAVAAWVATAEEPKEPKEPKEAEAAEEPEEAGRADSDEPGDEPEGDEPEADASEGAESADGESAVGGSVAGASVAGASEGDDETGEAEAEAPAEAKAPADSWFAARKAAELADSAPTDSPDEGDDAEDPEPEPEPEPVDQPTTMFKAVRLPVAPPVDQPTTALKLPPGLGADSDSERTSTFVPLRADIPAEQKAERAREAAQAPKAPASRPTPASTPAPASRPAPEAARPAASGPVAAPVPPAPAPAYVEAERTRQQPLPPLPPLDLLAELTNTPPPPPTPLRTTMRRVRIWTPLVLLVLIVFAIVQMVRPLPAPVLTLSAAPTFTFEGGELKLPFPTEGQGAVEVEGVGSMGTYGAQKPAPIASVTKTMTAYVILRDHPIKGSQKGPEIEIDAKAEEQGKAEHESTAAVQAGQTYSQKELLQLLMIPSANNVARLLARWDAGSEAAFVDKMNAAAKDLGMTQSTYTDPSGLLDSTVSTPRDQLKLAKAVMQYDVFREIVNMPNVTVDGIPGRIENNNNILLQPGVSGIKTGSSTPAGGNLLWSANTIVDGENRRILGIVMGAKDAADLGKKLQLAIDNSLKVIQQAQKDVTSAAVVRKGQVLGYIDDGLGGRTPVVATKELKAIGWPGLKVRLELTDGGKVLPHAGKAGDVVGQVSIGTGAGKVSSPVALKTDLVEPGFDKKLTRVG